MAEYRTIRRDPRRSVCDITFLPRATPTAGEPCQRARRAGPGAGRAAAGPRGASGVHDRHRRELQGAGRRAVLQRSRREEPADRPRPGLAQLSAIIRCHQTLAEMEKPVVGKINGDAVGFGQSMAFACDIIVAREDAVFMDHHMGGVRETVDESGNVRQMGHEFSNVPGDGGLALIPLLMPLPRAKEYLMLAEPYKATDLAELGIINHAVPAAELDAKVDDIVPAAALEGRLHPGLDQARRQPPPGGAPQPDPRRGRGLRNDRLPAAREARR